MSSKKNSGGPAYAPLPPRYYIFGNYDVWDKAQMLQYADDTHELRMQSLQAAPEGAPQQDTHPTADVVEKMISNTWDHFGDVLPTLKAISRGDWYWGANQRCKYIEIRIDTRDGGCLLFDSKRVRISPEQFSYQSRQMGKMDPWPNRNALDAAPAAKFKVGDLVTKTKGSQWTGRVVGTYSTTLTPEGYAVESSTERGSVQIYPAAALELVQGARAEQSAITSESGTPPAHPRHTPGTPPAEQQAEPGAVDRTSCTAGTDEECTRRGCATSCPAQQVATRAAPEAFLKSVIALCSHRGYSPANIEAWDKNEKWIADLWRQAEAMLAASPAPQPAPAPLSEREAEIAMIDAAMVEMANIVPPLKRSECASLIRAALAAQGGSK